MLSLFLNGIGGSRRVPDGSVSEDSYCFNSGPIFFFYFGFKLINLN